MKLAALNKVPGRGKSQLDVAVHLFGFGHHRLILTLNSSSGDSHNDLHDDDGSLQPTFWHHYLSDGVSGMYLCQQPAYELT